MNIKTINSNQQNQSFKAYVGPKLKDTTIRMARDLHSPHILRFAEETKGMMKLGASEVEHYYDYVGLDSMRNPLFHLQTNFPNADGRDGFFRFSTYAEEPLAINALSKKAKDFVDRGRLALRQGLSQGQAEMLSAEECEKLSLLV